MSNPDMRTRSPVPLDQCGTVAAANVIGDRWSLLIIREAFYGVKRYDDIRDDINIPRSVLTSRLKRLVEHGILEREAYREEGARTRYAYVLTKAGKELGLVLLALAQWGDKYERRKKPAIRILDAKTKRPLKVGLIEKSDPGRPLSKIIIKPNL